MAQSPLARGIAVFLLLLVSVGAASAQTAAQGDPVRFDSMGDFGNVGLMQNPTARMAPDGQLSLGFSRVWPHERYSLTMQVMPWLEATLRYTNTLNRLYGPQEFSGNQTLKDRGFDFKLRILAESRATPEVAVGFRDIGGTGLFAGEYIVANRRYFDWDFMLGIGWGYLGSRGQMRNPLRALSGSFDSRKNDVKQGGEVRTGSFFAGKRASWLAGVSYRTPIEGLMLKAELDGSDYQHEPQNNNQKVKSPINIGATYKLNDWLDVSLALERGDTAMFQFVFKENLKSSPGFPKFDPPPEAVRPRAASVVLAESERLANEKPITVPRPMARVTQQLEAAGFDVDAVTLDQSNQHLTAYVSQQTWRNHARAAGRAGRAIANSAPPQVEEMTVANLEAGVETHRISLLRRDLERAESSRVTAEDMWPKAGPLAPTGPSAAEEQRYLNPERYPSFSWNWAPALRQHIGGPDNPYFYQIYLSVGGELQLVRGLSLSGAVGINLYNNFDDLKLASDSVLPHVRSDIKDYLKEGKNNLARLQGDYITQISQNWYGKVSAGILEEMFAGAGGEVLYRPHGQRWAVGGNVYRVRQRDYNQMFDMLDYTVTTGHLDLHYRLPFYNIQTSLSVGKYLAGDKGATFEISRQFENGARVGAWATRTNVSAEQFGEGSFDKGIFISFPLDHVSLFSSRGHLNFAWRPLTRDGGQKLATGKPLSGLLYDSDPDTLASQWSSVLR